MAHGNFEQLQKLINLLDDRRNMIFLHVDRKVYDEYVSWGGVTSRYSKIYICDSYDVRWADISQTRVELALFDMVVNSGLCFNRIHLISGSDLPIKSQDYIHEYFRLYPDVEFLSFVSNPKPFERRLRYYHFFTKYLRNFKFAQWGRRAAMLCQFPFINRLKRCPYKFQVGPNWCSLTLRAVKAILDAWENCSNYFEYSLSSDECYKQMILSMDCSFTFSPLGNLRFVVWESGGSPRTLSLEDFPTLINSNCLFARKFDLNFNREIVDRIINTVSSK